MTTARDVAIQAVNLWKQVHGSESLDQQCQRYSGYYFLWAYKGNESGIVGYASARAAYQASAIQGRDVNTAPVGSVIFWNAAPYDHVGNVVGYDGGRALVAYATRYGDTVEELGSGVKISHADTYPHTAYGWAYANGRNQATSGLTDWHVQPVSGNQRQALAAGANARPAPNTQQPIVDGKGVKSNDVGNFDGWIHGENVNGNDIWFHGAISGNWFWSGGFTDTGTHDLADMNPKPVTGPTQRAVLAAAPANKRSDPSTQNASTGQFAAGALVDMAGFISGENVSGNATWFKATDGSYVWSGGFQDTGTHDLTDLSAPPVVTPPAASKDRIVTGAAVNKRSDPSTRNAATGQAAANATITMTGFAHSQAVNGNDVWFFDGTSWYWSGAFTSQSTDGLTDLSSTVTAPEVITPTTFGIDVSGNQAGFDFVAAKLDGVSFAIVKLGGHNTSKQTVSSDYPKLLDDTKAAGLKAGHYYVTGKGDPADEATFFVNNLHSFDVNSDVLCLDNELFDTAGGTINVNTAFWNDDQVSTFMQKVHDLTGIPFSRLWHYSNASEYRSTSWPKTEALGVKVWWAAYGPNPTDRHPDSEPVLGGVVADWWVHQFSSKQKVGNWVGSVDGNWSKHSVDELFAKGSVVDNSGGGGNGGGGTTTPPTTGSIPWIIAALTGLLGTITAILAAIINATH